MRDLLLLATKLPLFYQYPSPARGRHRRLLGSLMISSCSFYGSATIQTKKIRLIELADTENATVKMLTFPLQPGEYGMLTLRRSPSLFLRLCRFPS